MSRPRVLLADDHRMVAEGLMSLLAEDFDLVGVVENGRDLVSAVDTLKPDVVVSDISMPQLNGIDALVALKRNHPRVKVVFLTMHQNAVYARRALEAGASGFVVKHSAPRELVSAIRAVLNGKTFVTPSLANEELQEICYRSRRPAVQPNPLTLRQREILQFLADGLSAKEIASLLEISPRTVEFHKYQMMEAQGLHNSAELIHFAIKNGISAI